MNASRLPLLCLLLLVGCDIKTGRDADDFGSYYSHPGYGGYELVRYTLIGHLEVFDAGSGAPLSGIRVEGWIYDHEGRVRDSFGVRTNEMGLARIDVTTLDTHEPYSHLEIRILEPGFNPILKSLSIRKIDTLVDDQGTWTTIYETGGSFILSPR